LGVLFQKLLHYDGIKLELLNDRHTQTLIIPIPASAVKMNPRSRARSNGVALARISKSNKTSTTFQAPKASAVYLSTAIAKTMGKGPKMPPPETQHAEDVRVVKCAKNGCFFSLYGSLYAAFDKGPKRFFRERIIIIQQYCGASNEANGLVKV
jgi:hypothetical protein